MSSPKITLAQIRWSDAGVPFSTQFNDYYFSSDDGLAEIEHTFIQPNQLAKRFTNLATQPIFRIAETGFGSGLNFIKVVELWLAKAPSEARCHFISFEKFPMALPDLIKTHAHILKNDTGLQQIAQQLQANYPQVLLGWQDIYLFDGRVRLTLWLGDVMQGLPELSMQNKVDAWFLDGFAPAKNPQMWQATLFQQMARLSDLNTTFATFSAAGDVRRGLEKVGFLVKKASGFGKKREICFGQLGQQRSQSHKAPWFARPTPLRLPAEKQKAIVVGAGLAGATVAYKLAQQGWQVEVLEAAAEVATQASGNLAGTVHPLVTADWNLRSQWYLLGLQQTLRHSLPWMQSAATNKPSSMGELNGLLELLVDEKLQQRAQQALQRVGLAPEWVKLLDKEAASAILGTTTSYGALCFKQGGWLYPKAIIEKCLQQPNIVLHTETKVIDYSALSTQGEAPLWQVSTNQGDYSAPVLIFATGALQENLNQRLGLPIRPVKGQVTHLTDSQQQHELKQAVTHAGYSVSFPQGAVTGATFEAPDMSESLSQQGHEHNLQTTQSALPNWLKQEISATEVTGRIAFRPTTPDHLPIVGPVACQQTMFENYLSQSHTHAVYRYAQQQYQAGLFVSNGHGPRGLMSVFLAAEMIYADLSGETLPMPLKLYYASHPARFAIRHWRSGHLST